MILRFALLPALIASIATTAATAAPSFERDVAAILRTRCAAGALVSIGRPRDAASALDAGLGHLRDAAERIGIGAAFDSLSDVVGLRTLRDTLVPQLPPAQRTELEERLRAAVRAENYELAAILRDELRLMERVTD